MPGRPQTDRPPLAPKGNDKARPGSFVSDELEQECARFLGEARGPFPLIVDIQSMPVLL
ncbi:MAG TPA: hypothetical protein VGQ68_03635 [Gaiellaceae bacterium]|jgi:hypothetical protein|nr:hypothetical protein [Gaiellaceae bacterium]